MTPAQLDPWARGSEEDRWDGYFIPGTNVLRNNLGIRNAQLLWRAEAVLSANALARLQVDPLPTQSFDWEHLSALHRRLFGDVYPWAGEARTVDIAKGSGPFAHYTQLRGTIDELGRILKENDYLRNLDRPGFVAMAGAAYNVLNAVHPWREGNGRTQRAFMDDLATTAGWRFDWTRVHGQVNDAATEAARHGDSSLLDAMMDRITGPHPTRLVEDAASLRRAAFPQRGKGPARPQPRAAGYSTSQGLDSASELEP